ncbi:MAG: BLUF domain-containing protein [Steroidobacteraceae bacterium]
MSIHTEHPLHRTHLTIPLDILVNSLSHLIYASSAESHMGATKLCAILDRARVMNAQLNVTGILLHSEGSFFQVLEGDAEVIDSLYAKIARDKRHKNTVVIVREPIASRSFADWSMGFASVTPKDIAGIIGANDFFQKKSCFYQLNAGRAKKLLAAFADGRWRASSAA